MTSSGSNHPLISQIALTLQTQSAAVAWWLPSKPYQGPIQNQRRHLHKQWDWNGNEFSRWLYLSYSCQLMVITSQ